MNMEQQNLKGVIVDDGELIRYFDKEGSELKEIVKK